MRKRNFYVHLLTISDYFFSTFKWFLLGFEIKIKFYFSRFKVKVLAGLGTLTSFLEVIAYQSLQVFKQSNYLIKVRGDQINYAQPALMEMKMISQQTREYVDVRKFVKI